MLCLLRLLFPVVVRSFCSRHDLLSENLALRQQRVEDLAVQELISQFRVEAFAVAVLPWRARFDVQCFSSSCGQPVARSLAANSEPLSDRRCSGAPFMTIASDHQVLPGVFIDQIQYPHGSSIVRPGADEILAPHGVRAPA